MKQNPLLLPLVGGGLTFLCFFLTWISIDLSTLNSDITFPQMSGMDITPPKLEGIVSITGFKLATGGGNLKITLSLLTAIAIIAICIYMLIQNTPSKSKIPILICSGIGLLIILFVILPNLSIISFGVFGAAIGFVIAFIGAWNIPQSEVATEINEDAT